MSRWFRQHLCVPWDLRKAVSLCDLPLYIVTLVLGISDQNRPGVGEVQGEERSWQEGCLCAESGLDKSRMDVARVAEGRV